MPPPPPPSKSYLLVFDTDSENEEEDEYRVYHRPMVVTPTPPTPTQTQTQTQTQTIRTTPRDASSSSTPEKTSAGSRRPHVVDDDDDDEEEADSDASSSSTPEKTSAGSGRPHVVEEEEDDLAAPKDTCRPTSTTSTTSSSRQSSTKLTKNQKKRLAQKRKKKKSKCSSVDVDVDDPSKEPSPSVTFSTVSVRTYARCFSADTVPLDGGWPLGMELDNYENGDEVSLDECQNKKQEDLRQRWEQKKTNCDATVIQNMTKRPDGTPLVLETRLWDYKIGIKNPLFGVLNEEQRQALFVQQTSNNSDNSHMSSNTSNNGSNSPSNNNSSSPSKRRSRSNSTSSECFNETYNQVYVHHVRNELEQIRIKRTKAGATGCNCRKLTVYLPPKDGSGGKRAQHRRMKPSKLMQELKKRGIYDPSASREDLEQTLHKAVKKEPCCGLGDDCFCARNGIDCQADSCSCWYDSHVHTKASSTNGSGRLSVQDIQDRCGNPLGMATVDMVDIDSFRNKLLESKICQPVGSL